MTINNEILISETLLMLFFKQRIQIPPEKKNNNLQKTFKKIFQIGSRIKIGNGNYIKRSKVTVQENPGSHLLVIWPL